MFYKPLHKYCTSTLSNCRGAKDRHLQTKVARRASCRHREDCCTHQSWSPSPGKTTQPLYSLLPHPLLGSVSHNTQDVLSPSVQMQASKHKEEGSASGNSCRSDTLAGIAGQMCNISIPLQNYSQLTSSMEMVSYQLLCRGTAGMGLTVL